MSVTAEVFFFSAKEQRYVLLEFQDIAMPHLLLMSDVDNDRVINLLQKIQREVFKVPCCGCFLHRAKI
jgi:hypothetical protein